MRRVAFALSFFVFKDVSSNLHGECSGLLITSHRQRLSRPTEEHLAAGHAFASANGRQKALKAHVRQNPAWELAKQNPL